MSASYQLSIRQGDTFRFSATYRAGNVPVDLTGYTAEMVISWPAHRPSNAAPIAAGEVLPTMAALDSTGVIVATLTNDQTAVLPLAGDGGSSLNMTYQLRIRVSDDPVTTLLSGAVNVRPDLFELV